MKLSKLSHSAKYRNGFANSIALLALIGAFGFSGCNYNDLKNGAASGKPGGGLPGDRAAQAVVDYETVKAKVFASACLKCHGESVARASLRLDTYGSTFPNLAKIRGEVDAGNMPPPPPRGAVLSVEQKAMLFAWLDSGGPETTSLSPPTDSTAPPTGSPTGPVPDFTQVSQAVFIPHCVKCHSYKGAKGGVNLEDYANAARHASEIGLSLDTDDMPRRAPALDPALKTIVYAWLAGGTPGPTSLDRGDGARNDNDNN